MSSAVIAEWDALRASMIRTCPPEFSRVEWAYLISFLDPENLELFRASAFDGWPEGANPKLRGEVALWLPNNVSLLGPLMLVSLSLIDAKLRVKAGSRSEDLTSAFLRFLDATLPTGGLKTWVETRVNLQVFDSKDPRTAEMAAESAVRIVFGSDRAGDAIAALPHPDGSSQINFTHRVSEAWFSRPGPADLDTLIQVLAVYGQAGCTSPSRIVLLGAGPAEAVDLAERLAARWTELVKEEPAPHISSNTMMAAQWARANGWSAVTADQHAAVFAAGDFSLDPFECEMGLPVIAATVEEAIAQVPSNAQTLGWAGDQPPEVGDGFLRVVPLGEMHHFAPVWDGHVFLRECLEESFH